MNAAPLPPNRITYESGYLLDRRQRIKDLAADLTKDPLERGLYEMRLTSAMVNNPDYGLGTLGGARRLVALADSYRQADYITAEDDSYSTSCTRRDSLALMYQARFDATPDQAVQAVLKGRMTDRSALLGLLARDALSASVFAAALGGVGYATVAGMAATTGAAHAAWQAGGVAGKAQALGWSAATGVVGISGIGLARNFYAIFSDVRRSEAQTRREVWTNEMGKDLLLTEVITGRRYIPPPRAVPIQTKEWPESQAHHYLGGHAR